ncbi:DUF6797 domain-containing protein [Spirosoma sordidisoli]|nr:plastocyanin/azurin family copper-binding protein [Spirosoma sordidisoli]
MRYEFMHLILSRLRASLLLLLPLGISPVLAQQKVDTTITLKSIAGLQYDQPRLVLKPKTRLRLVLENYDDMAHNLVVTRPNARVRVVDAALRMGAEGASRHYVPDMPEVLAHTREVEPGRADTLLLTVDEGAFPYVCTYPGHGYVMYGILYGTRDPKRLPPPEADPYLPKRGSTADHAGHHQPSGHPYEVTLPAVYRTFMPDCGPAAIAVGMPGLAGGPVQSYCFDAGICQLRYAWSGGFVDNADQWDGKGQKLTKLVGDIYYVASSPGRASTAGLTVSTATKPGSAPAPSPAGLVFPLRIGNKPAGHSPVVQFRGYRLINRYPEFQYVVDGVTVRELIKPLPGGRGLVRQFSIDSAKQPVTFLADEQPGLAYRATRAGKTAALRNGQLLLPAGTRQFTIFMTVQ